jgi:putative transposase
VGVLDASTLLPKERYAVSKDNIIQLIHPGNVEDQLIEILRNGARVLLAQAFEAEVADLLGKHTDFNPGGPSARCLRRSPARARGDDRYRSDRRPPAACARSREDAADPDRIRISGSAGQPSTF